MSEFMDYLTREYAYVAIGEFKPGKFPEAKALYEKAIASYAEGFKGSYLLQLPGTDKGIAIVFWDSMEAMQASETEVHQAIIKQLSHLFATNPNTNVYEVVNSSFSAKY